jgi:sec-independent protein translocase protein TatB
MFPLEQGAFEMLVIGAIALIVVGPKDLPVLMRRVGQFTAKMRGMAAEFRASFDEMARQSELDELRKEVEALRTGQYVAPVAAGIDHQPSVYDQDAPVPMAPETQAAAPAVTEPAPVAKKPRARKTAPTAPAAGAAPKTPRKPRAPKAPDPELSEKGA